MFNKFTKVGLVYGIMKIKTIKSNLQSVINYGKNGDKTDNGILVSCINPYAQINNLISI